MIVDGILVVRPGAAGIGQCSNIEIHRHLLMQILERRKSQSVGGVGFMTIGLARQRLCTHRLDTRGGQYDQQIDRPDSQDIAWPEEPWGSGRKAGTVNKSAVSAAAVHDATRFPIALDGGVLSRYLGHREYDVVVGAAADGDLATVYRILAAV
jgi:hypothetical protein